MPSATYSNKAQVLFGPKDLRLTPRDLSGPLADEVQIAVRSTTLCGSDVHYYTHFANGDIIVREPLSQGHEASGDIVSLGSDVEKSGHLKIGARVAIEAGIPCGICEVCEDGRYNLCDDMRFRSSAVSFPHFQGTLQERLNHPAKWCHLLPETISYEEGALLEPLSVAVHAVRKARVSSTSSCLILGAGAVGLLVAAVLRTIGCSEVVMADIAGNRLDFAKKHGFASEVSTILAKRGKEPEEKLQIAREVASSLLELRPKSHKSSLKYHVTFECTGVESCVQTAIYSTRAGGNVVLVGMGSPVQTLPMSVVGNREVDLLGVWRYAKTYPEAMKIMQASKDSSAGIPDIRKLITHSFEGLNTVPDAFGLAAKTTDGDGNLVIKVVINN
ncbi:GroES-like protein [Glarea lozoyensis ATCC 20868]|uniref:GroES-like protein n=1 Tax=Glarea lozoyensis (strain ATCC 20868 / MF5171) TaxID=1116229 RepID=S3E917_GLAL2|nr:GroES-like protein [Glarea lozoyensis ATCC 20868]EPE34758.1 GroES-like protein [Glarea lozoyensis ATCC 20868]